MLNFFEKIFVIIKNEKKFTKIQDNVKEIL